MKCNLEEVKQLSFWIVERIARNRSKVIDPELGCDWDWIAGEVWDFYPGIVNEFLINDAIDLIIEAAKCSE
jgi:hypothetical protein